MDVEIVLHILSRLISAVPVTLALALASTVLSVAVAIVATACRRSSFLPLRGMAELYVLAFRAMPMLVQLFVLYYGLSQFAWLRASPLWFVLRSPFACAVIAISFCTGAYMAEVMRGGLASVPAGAVEAARSLGLSRNKAFLLVVLPIAVRRALPAFGSEVVLTLKATSLASTVTVIELTGMAKDLMSETFAVIEVFSIAALLYLALSTMLILAFQRFEAAMTPLHERTSIRNAARRAQPSRSMPTTRKLGGIGKWGEQHGR
ncbi:octopine/nopaline transport system permease protein [Rhizobiales bacterium GAS113]|nr:octopine/nopaline transport system permease protein [Rhizobiales bacterium GAS113]SEB76908.1 octopine/nopaline transport system permease protein [Rhizobiales bacterium GAS188]